MDLWYHEANISGIIGEQNNKKEKSVFFEIIFVYFVNSDFADSDFF